MAKVNFYAAAKAAAGNSAEEIDATSLGDLVKVLTERSPELAKLIPTCSYLVNGESCQELTQVLTSDDNIDVLPQFAGG